MFEYLKSKLNHIDTGIYMKKSFNNEINHFKSKDNFLYDESGQGAAEYILLFGGVLVIAIAALMIYKSYFTDNAGLNASNDIKSVRENMSI